MNSGFRNLLVRRDAARFKAYFLAIAVQMLVLPFLELLGIVRFSSPAFYPLGATLGGFLFGLAMNWGGGFILGASASLAGGCTVGHGLTGIPLLSLGSVVFTGFAIWGHGPECTCKKTLDSGLWYRHYIITVITNQLRHEQ
jgi:hypothetical protein